MPRNPRFYLPDIPVQIVQRGHSREPVFFDSQDYSTYAHWVSETGFRLWCVYPCFCIDDRPLLKKPMVLLAIFYLFFWDTNIFGVFLPVTDAMSNFFHHHFFS